VGAIRSRLLTLANSRRGVLRRCGYGPGKFLASGRMVELAEAWSGVIASAVHRTNRGQRSFHHADLPHRGKPPQRAFSEALHDGKRAKTMAVGQVGDLQNYVQGRGREPPIRP